MSLAAEAQISLDALKAAFDGKQGSDPNKVLLASDIDKAMLYYWNYIALLGYTPDTQVTVPS